MFDDLNLSQDTKKLLNELVKRKNKCKALKRNVIIITCATLLLIAIIFASFYRMLNVQAIDSLAVLRNIVGQKFLLFIILLTASLFIYNQSVSKEYKKAKKKYDDLREETVSKFFTHWTINKHTALRDEISERLDKLGINIRHIS